MEATACLVDVAVFKTDEGAEAPWRVRFPSASARSDASRRTQRERTLLCLGVPSEEGVVAFVEVVDLGTELGHERATLDLE